MNAANTHVIRTVDLGVAQMLVIDAARAQRLRVLSGAAWLTQEGDHGDAVLGPGAERRLCGGRVVIEALVPARVQLVRERGLGGGPMPGLAAWMRPLRRWARRLQFGPAMPEPAV